MLRVLRTIGLALGLLGGVIASQAPEFAQQYVQRLGGAVDELKRIVAQFDADAASTGETRDKAVRRLQANPDRLVQRRGDAARAEAQRLDELEAQRRRLAEARGPLDRTWILLGSADPTVASAAYRDFVPAVPTTGEGALTAGIGFALGWGLWRFALGGTRRLARLARGRRSLRTVRA